MATIAAITNRERISLIRIGIQQLNRCVQKVSDVDHLIASYKSQTEPNPGEIVYYANLLLDDAKALFETALSQLCILASGTVPTAKDSRWRQRWEWTAGADGVASIQFVETTDLIYINAVSGTVLGEFSGFEVGDVITVTGATNAGNNGDHIVTDIGAAGAYVEVSGSTLVNETKTDTVVLTLTEANVA
jgi:hypothetical protein